MSKAVFSFSELLVLLDVADVGPMSSPLPTVDELATMTKAVRFRTGLNHLYEPPRAHLNVSPIFVQLSIDSFPDRAIWENMFGWVSGYIQDTLTKAPKSAGPSGYRAYKGDGLLLHWGYTKPAGHLSSRDLELEVRLFRDEHPISTIQTLLGLDRSSLAEPLDENWRTIASTYDMHVEASAQGEVVRLRSGAPQHAGKVSAAAACRSWAGWWLQLVGGFGTGVDSEHQHATAYELPAGRVVLFGGQSARRDVCELHVPRSWLDARIAPPRLVARDAIATV